MLPVVSMEGRVVADPELRFSPNGVAVGRVRLVASSRKKNEESGEWEDDKTCWITVTCFKKLAEHVAESVVKGDLINVTGKLQTEEWESDGQKRSATVMVADTVAKSLAFAPIPVAAKETKAEAPPQEDAPPF